jgi:hypothetical protein
MLILQFNEFAIVFLYFDNKYIETFNKYTFFENLFNDENHINLYKHCRQLILNQYDFDVCDFCNCVEYNLNKSTYVTYNDLFNQIVYDDKYIIENASE